MKKTLKLTLLSDMCVSDGGVYNSSLDADVCYDEYGFPFIPAKRIKGCLRECALELNDWGKSIDIEGLFGNRGNKGASLRIGNAYPEDYERKKECAVQNQQAQLFHPQNILNHYSYIRTQTSINYETGAAEDNSLRTMRVVNKDCVFKADIEFDGKYENELRDCCAILANMGMNRTRGLGEVEAALEDSEQTDHSRKADLTEGADWLEYSVYLDEPVICKSINKGEAETLDYIEGSKILGIIAQRLGEENKDIADFMKERLYCTNAYITYDDKRCVEVPASYYSIKNDSKHYTNKVYETADQEASGQDGEKKQLNMMKHCYVLIDGQELIKVNVRTEERYHHSRPEDKSIGRAIDDAQFYHMESIRSGQKFKGYISGTEEQISRIAELLSKKDTYYIGYGRNAEYGKVRLRIETTGKKAEKALKQCKHLVVKLEAPAIIYNRKAFYSTDVNDLIEEIDCLLGLTGTECQADRIDKFLNYATVGGFNVTWGKRKPTIDVFDKGTVLVYHFDSPVDLTLPVDLFIGERTSEGYGEISIENVSDITITGKYMGTVSSIGEKQNATVRYDQNNSLMRDLCGDLFKQFVRLNSVNGAKDWIRELAKEWKEKKSKRSVKDIEPTVSNMMQMCKDNSSYAKIKGNVNERYDKDSETKQDKLGYANKILTAVEKRAEIQKEEFERTYGIQGYIVDSKIDVKYEYLVSFLTELKYRIRQSKTAAEGGNTGE